MFLRVLLLLEEDGLFQLPEECQSQIPSCSLYRETFVSSVRIHLHKSMKID